MDETMESEWKNESLRVAVVVSDLKRFKTCLTGGADINESDSNGNTPLQLAALKGNLRIVQLLFERTDLVPNKANENGDTLLHSAAEGGNIDIFKLFFERLDQDPYTVNKSGHNLLHSAVEGENQDIVQLLLERTNIDPKIVDKDGQTLLHSAAERGNIDIVKVLLERTNLDPNKGNKFGNTVLHSAVEGRHPNIVKLLLNRSDIDLNKVNKNNKTSFEVFRTRYSHRDVDMKTKRIIQDIFKSHDTDKFVTELRGLHVETTDDLKEVMKFGSFKCFWNRVYIVGPYFSGKSCLAKLLVGDKLPQARESTDGIWIYMGRAGMDLDTGKWIFIPKGAAVQEILVSMMMTFSKNESLDNDNQIPSSHESEINLISRPDSTDSGSEEIVLLENPVQSIVHKEHISEVQSRECFDVHDCIVTDDLSEVSKTVCSTANETKMLTMITKEEITPIVHRKNALHGQNTETSNKIVPETENNALGIVVATANTNKLFSEESKTLNVNQIENSPSKNISKESGMSEFLEERITLCDQPKEIRASSLIVTENNASDVVKAKCNSTPDIYVVGSNSANDDVAGFSKPDDFSMKTDLHDTQISNDYLDMMEKPASSTPITCKRKRSIDINPVREKYKEKLMKEVANELSHDKLHEMVISSIREGQYKQKIIPIDIWDFGGQKDYYMTHQLFITSRGIFVLVFNGSLNLHKHRPDLSFLPGHFGKPTIAVYLLHWVNSILTYCKRSDDGFPRIIFVATHKDKIRQNVDKHKQKVETVIQSIFESHAGLKHLEFKPLIFVNAMKDTDPEIQALRQRLMDRAKEHPRWGEHMPTAWVPLELHLAMQAEKGVNILTKDQIKMFNSRNESMELTDKQLEIFLKVQHSLGKLLYFDIANLRDFVIITPAYLVEVLRSIVTEKQFWPKGKRFRSIFQTMQKTGALSRDDIDVLWNQEVFEQILQFKDFIIEVLIHLDILVAERKITEAVSTSPRAVSKFIVPAMITKPNNTKYLQKFCNTGTAILLSYKFIEKVIPPAFPYRFIASFVDMWGVKNYKNKKSMLFSDLAVVEVDDKHDVTVQVIENRVVVSLIHADKKKYIVPTIANSVQECLTAAIYRISEFYSTLSADLFATDKGSEFHMVMPFEIEFGVHCKKKTSCFFRHDKIPTSAKWQCSEHGLHHDVSCLKLWFSEKMPREKCDSSCKGLGRLEIEQSPSNKHLRRLAASLEDNDCRELLIKLGFDTIVLNNLQEKFSPSAFHENDYKYTAMLRWKGSVTDSSFKTIANAFGEFDKHLLCEVIRDVNVDDVLKKFSITEDQANKTPTSTTLQELSNHIGNSGTQLGVELGLQSAAIQGIQNDHRCKLLHQNKEILRVWSQTKFPKPTVKELVKSLQRIGKIDCLREISF